MKARWTQVAAATGNKPTVASFLWLTVYALIVSSEAADGDFFRYDSYASIVKRMEHMAEKYPQMMRLSNAQERFGIESVGTCRNHDGEEEPCKIWIAEITNYDTLDENLDRPQMAISGELHGDEIIGPQAAIAYIELLLTLYGKNDSISRLIDTRVLTIVPMTNAIGYETRHREEKQDDGSLIDANRDFAFEQEPNRCMQTAAARAINELFRTHMYRVLITFHGGTNVIGYEWGDTRHCHGQSCVDAPDKLAMATLAERMKNYAGPAGKFEKEYVVGDMGSTVYAVGGGMEDWGYGASWTEHPVICKPSAGKAYPEEKTKYNSATHRCVTYLVETAHDKQPNEQSLGTSEDIFTVGGKGDGHVPRNLRLLLAVTDSLEPYVVIKKLTLKDSTVRCEWYVGGAFTVGETWVEYTVEGAEWKAKTVPEKDVQGSFVFNGEERVFSADFDIPNRGDLIVRVVAVRVDEDFGRNAGVGEPQSHFVRARLDPQWQYNHNGSVVSSYQVQGTDLHQSETKIYHSDSKSFESLPLSQNVITWDALSLQGSSDEKSRRRFIRRALIFGGIGVSLVLFIAIVFQVVKPRWSYLDVLSMDNDARSAQGYSLATVDDDEDNDDVPLRLYP